METGVEESERRKYNKNKKDTNYERMKGSVLI